MSYTILYCVPEKGEFTHEIDIRNSWRGAVFIWNALSERYLNRPAYVNENLQPVWDLHKDERLSLSERITLLTTFDRAMVQRSRIPDVITAFRDFIALYGSNNNLSEQIQALEKLESLPECFAVCWNQTSVTDAWYVYESDDELRLYDLSRDTGHWFLFAGVVSARPAPQPDDEGVHGE